MSKLLSFFPLNKGIVKKNFKPLLIKILIYIGLGIAVSIIARFFGRVPVIKNLFASIRKLYKWYALVGVILGFVQCFGSKVYDDVKYITVPDIVNFFKNDVKKISWIIAGVALVLMCIWPAAGIKSSNLYAKMYSKKLMSDYKSGKLDKKIEKEEAKAAEKAEKEAEKAAKEAEAAVDEAIAEENEVQEEVTEEVTEETEEETEEEAEEEDNGRMNYFQKFSIESDGMTIDVSSLPEGYYVRAVGRFGEGPRIIEELGGDIVEVVISQNQHFSTDTYECYLVKPGTLEFSDDVFFAGEGYDYYDGKTNPLYYIPLDGFDMLVRISRYENNPTEKLSERKKQGNVPESIGNDIMKNVVDAFSLSSNYDNFWDRVVKDYGMFAGYKLRSDVNLMGAIREFSTPWNVGEIIMTSDNFVREDISGEYTPAVYYYPVGVQSEYLSYMDALCGDSSDFNVDTVSGLIASHSIKNNGGYTFVLPGSLVDVNDIPASTKSMDDLPEDLRSTFIEFIDHPRAYFETPSSKFVVGSYDEARECFFTFFE